MTTATALRSLYAIPVLGRIARDLTRSKENLWYLLVAMITLLIIGVKIWGVVVLSMAALALVPMIFVVLLLITRG